MHLLCETADMSLMDLVKTLAGMGGGAMAIVGLVAISRGWFVTAAQYAASEARTKQMQAERDEWKAAALRSLQNNTRAVAMIERTAGVGETNRSAGDGL